MINKIKISREQIDSFYLNGFIKISNLISKKNVETLKQDLECFLEKNKSLLSDRDINFTKNKIINSVHNLSNWKWVTQLQNNNFIRSIISKLLNDQISNFGAEIFFKQKKEGLAVPTHQDNYYWCLKDPNAVTVWIALDKANKTNGGIFYHKGSHLLGLLEHERSMVPGSSQKIKYPRGLDKFQKSYPKLNVGDCLIHHSLVAHGSLKNNSNNSRVGLTLRYKKKNIRKDSFLVKKYENDLLSQMKIRKKNAI
tara:strand:- start:20528 stop:21286 length:759 start_codon:yes stop_codon:yes gene_type:complete